MINLTVLYDPDHHAHILMETILLYLQTYSMLYCMLYMHSAAFRLSIT